MDDLHGSYGSEAAKGVVVVDAEEEEEDRPLGRLRACVGDYRHGGGGGADVDCSLRLGPPGTGLVDARAGSYTVPGVEGDPMQRISSAPPSLGCSSHPQQTGFPATSELCTMCATTHTPLWRSGPLGPKSLCNACGIRYKKEERRLALTLGFSSSSHPQSKSRQQQPRRQN